MPPNQFGLQKQIGYAQALTPLSLVLVNADKRGELLVPETHVSRTFDSIIHAHIPIKTYKRGVST